MSKSPRASAYLPTADVGFSRVAVVVGCAAFGLVLMMLVTGVGLRDAVLLTVVVALEWWAGAYLWLLLIGVGLPRTSVDVLELAGGGLALGAFLSLAGALATTIGTGSTFGALIPAVAAGGLLAVRVVRRKRRTVAILAIRRSILPAGAGVLAAAGVLALSIRRYPLDLSQATAQFHPDMLFFEALSSSLARLGPFDSNLLAGGGVRYHWLGYAWAGQLSDLVGAQPFVTLTRLLPTITGIALVCLVAAWTARLSSRAWVPFLAVLLVILGSYPGAQNGAILNFDSPSQYVATLWMLALLVAALRFVTQASSPVMLLLCAALAVATTGGKISAGAVAIAGFGAAAALGTMFRLDWRRRMTMVALVVGIAFVATLTMLTRGSSDSGGLVLFELDSKASTVQGLDPWASSAGVILGTVALGLAIWARWSGIVWLWTKKGEWQRPEGFLALGLALGGLLPVLFLSQGTNETWFPLAASAPLAALSAVGLGVGWSGREERFPAVLAVVLAVVAVALSTGVAIAAPGVGLWVVAIPVMAYLLGMVGEGVAVIRRHQTGSVGAWGLVLTTTLVVSTLGARLVNQAADSTTNSAGVPVVVGASLNSPSGESSPDIWSLGELEGARFLGTEVGADDLVFTTEPLSLILPAIARTRTVLSGAGYLGAIATSTQIAEANSKVEQLMTESSATRARRILCESGVDWVWAPVSHPVPAAWEVAVKRVLATTEVTIYEFDSTLCESS